MMQPTPTSPDSAALAALPPLPTAVWLPGMGCHIDVSPLRLGELPAFTAAIAPMGRALQLTMAQAVPDWLGLVALHGQHCISALAIATRQPQDTLAKLDLADAVTLIEAAISVNADFFTHQVLPRLEQAQTRLSSSSSTWLKPSPGSPAPGTVTPTS